MRFSGLKISTQLALAASAFLSCLLATGGAAWLQTKALWLQTEGLYRHPLPEVVLPLGD